jgi:hypothetical protein
MILFINVKKSDTLFGTNGSIEPVCSTFLAFCATMEAKGITSLSELYGRRKEHGT